ncbi:MAG: tetratricopeptide repeat protein [Xenococcaceae cyanobacterium MO_188.B32]|nr:tetratricopeptide repeat protein [Xenococcaceae cyanobacterium MO_188.B32]
MEYLELSNTSLSTQQALEILYARDALQDVLKTQGQVSPEIHQQVTQLDLRLKHKAGRILRVLNLSEYRESLPDPPQDWWWHLDSKQVNWLIRGLTVITWTGSLGSQTAAVYQLLGDLYLQVGLSQQAKSPYLKALEIAKRTEDLEGQAEAQVGLGQVEGKKTEAIGWLTQAQTNYQRLGDRSKVEEVQQWIKDFQ